ncbi:MAG: hypothetical protein RLP44_04150 [Aggregatilineales bacterium]
MTIDSTLERFVYGKPITDDNTEPTVADILAITPGLSLENAILCRSLTSIEPLPLENGNASQSVGLFRGIDDDFILVHARFQHDNPERPIFQYVILPADVLQGASGNIKTLAEITDLGTADYRTTHESLDTLSVPPVPTWIADRRVALFERVLTHTGGDMRNLLYMLDGALGENGLQICGFVPSVDKRLDFVEAITLLLPPAVRADMTFTTNTDDPTFTRAAIIFSEQTAETSRERLNTSDMPDVDTFEFQSIYVGHLATLWHGSVEDFVSDIRTVERLVQRIVNHSEKTLSSTDLLDQITRQHKLDLQVMTDEDVPIDSIHEALVDHQLNDDMLLARYAERLLTYALDERDTHSAEIVAKLMDENNSLDEKLNAALENTLKVEPDAVYSFIRTHLSNGVNERWLPRLNAAATISLDIAINDGDNDTLMSWLRLLAREPANYKLGDVLQRGILATQKRTYEDGKLGMQLLSFAIKRAHNALDMLLDDDALINALPEPLGPALRDYDSIAVGDLLETGREFSMVLFARSAEDHAQASFTDESIQYLWESYNEGQNSASLPPRYQPGTILEHLLETGAEWLSLDASETLLTLFIADGRSDLFRRFGGALAQQSKLTPLLPTALNNSEQSPDMIISLINQLVTDEIIVQQQSVDTLIYLIDARGWSDESRVLIEQVARSLQQNPGLAVTRDTVWKLLDVAQAFKSELVMRATTRRAMQVIEKIEDDQSLIDNLLHVYENVRWSNGGSTIVANQWRTFVNTQPLARLQHISRLMDSTKLLEDSQSILQTTIAIRKLMGKRTLGEFATDISAAFNILQLLSDSFDPSNRQTIDFDQETVRMELDTHDDELTPNERNLLAKNLKELAQLVILMADNRSKSSLIRREGNIERQLLTGEQSPQSAIDTMKWLSGYLSGMQKDEDDN